jgi:hypothetical protein
MHQHVQATGPTKEEKAKRMDLKTAANVVTWLHREVDRLHVPFLESLSGMAEPRLRWSVAEFRGRHLTDQLFCCQDR